MEPQSGSVSLGTQLSIFAPGSAPCKSAASLPGSHPVAGAGPVAGVAVAESADAVR